MFSYEVFFLVTPQNQATPQRKQISKLKWRRSRVCISESSYRFLSKCKGHILNELCVPFNVSMKSLMSTPSAITSSWLLPFITVLSIYQLRCQNHQLYRINNNKKVWAFWNLKKKKKKKKKRKENRKEIYGVMDLFLFSVFFFTQMMWINFNAILLGKPLHNVFNSSICETLTKLFPLSTDFLHFFRNRQRLRT